MSWAEVRHGRGRSLDLWLYDLHKAERKVKGEKGNRERWRFRLTGDGSRFTGPRSYRRRHAQSKNCRVLGKKKERPGS